MSDGVSQRELEVQNAKAALLQSGTYDVLAKGIRKILDERPSNAVDMLGQIFDKVKLESCAGDENLTDLQVVTDKSVESEVAEIQKNLYEAGAHAEGEMGEDEEEQAITVLPDMNELLYFFEQGGVGLSREEWVRVYFAMKKLTDQVQLASCRFWGKMLGLDKNYYIAEVQLLEPEEAEEDSEDSSSSAHNESSENLEEDDDEDEDKLPKSSYKSPPKVPNEPNSQAGANKHCYYVCNEPGESWTRLPTVTPAQISAARQVTKFFTGDLTAAVNSFPKFPGNESNLLRAQIARISAGCIIAPMTYYQFDEEEEVDEEELAQTEFIENPEFEGVPVRDLADPSLQAWVHARLPLLNQGRCIWWNPKQRSEEDEEMDDEDEEGENDEEQVEQEIGPPLLTQLSEDIEITGLPAWSTHLSSGIMHIQHAICIIKSNLWPGAVSFSNGRRFENIYIGNGNKYNTDNYSPPMCNSFEGEYREPEIIEVADPTVEEENALKAQAEANREDELEDEEEDADDWAVWFFSCFLYRLILINSYHVQVYFSQGWKFKYQAVNKRLE